MYEISKEAIQKDKPNFFTLAYYKMMNPTADVENIDISELNKITKAIKAVYIRRFL